VWPFPVVRLRQFEPPTSNCSDGKLFAAAALAAALIGAALALPACIANSAGSGMAELSNAPVTLSWASKDGGITGTLSAAIDTMPSSGAAVTAAGAFSAPVLPRS